MNLKEEFFKIFNELKEKDDKVIGFVVTDRSGLLIFSSSGSRDIEILGGIIGSIVRRAEKIIKRYEKGKIIGLTLRIDEYKIIIIPMKHTISAIIKRIKKRQ